MQHVGFNKPRAAVVELLGEANQSCPMLVIGDGTDVDGLSMQTASGNRFFFGDRPIAAYLAKRYGIASIHGDDSCALAQIPQRE